MTGQPFVLQLTRPACKHLAIAIRMYRSACTDQFIGVPPELRAIQESFADYGMNGSGQVSTGQDGSLGDTAEDRRNTRQVQPKLLTRQQAADVLGVSLSTIKRRIAVGEINTVTTGRTVRIHCDEIDSFIRTLEKH